MPAAIRPLVSAAVQPVDARIAGDTEQLARERVGELVGGGRRVRSCRSRPQLPRAGHALGCRRQLALVEGGGDLYNFRGRLLDSLAASWTLRGRRDEQP